MKTTTKAFLLYIGGTIVALALLVGLSVGGWKLYWWMAGASTNNTAHIYQNSYGSQSARAQEAQNLISQVQTIDVQLADPSTPATESTALASQKQAIVTQACNLVANINTPTPDVATFAAANCA